jgi:hypothetical protein
VVRHDEPLGEAASGMVAGCHDHPGCYSVMARHASTLRVSTDIAAEREG